MPIGRDPKLVSWHKLAKPSPIKEKMHNVRVTTGFIACIGFGLLLLGFVIDFLAFQLSGIVLVWIAFIILIMWEVIKKDYAKNYKKNLRQWKKTRKH